MSVIVKRIFRAILVVFVTAVSGCGTDKTPPSNAEVAGTYMGRYGGGVETFDIDPDSSFTQTFRIGTNVVYSSSGKWNFSEGRVHFEPFMSPDAIKSGVPDGKPDSHPRSFGTWHRQPIRIELGEWPHHAAKVKGEGATIKPYKQE